ncbi:MAG: ATP-binding cassette domain-containing protein [Rhodobacteraceae bacterium]|jgi:ATP-binding cassette subfamily F protein uup|uniref:ABC-F family ATP-binding cassette domain-containing protein n=1 Tax=Roseovarius sp. 10 TaxID=3080563 RepID=UPI0019372DF1|nr:ABC-F family ATP-binding cassette domain-containing protein [Roseovarius sp. 10]MBE1288572.1 ATP-binding cassette domain-containing protein [Paracoccaceae bacterium]MDV7199875.1 ABC-F family ATP-binding cassette domain-containing protein [Roseovarius sp. 10]QPI86043.1 ABC-F family ATP-binding cassette domain-containing protein [Rhodobacterales bacterium HKCCA1288]
MARPSLLQLSDISLTFGGDPIFDGLDLVVHQGDRVALVGRNGSGKSTLMKVMAGLTEPDTGSITSPQGTSVGYMEQEPDFTGFATLGDFATATLGPSEAWRVEALADGLKLRLDADPAKASGGERRRAALARLLAEEPDIMLLDEPTNHLDIEAIGWLEARLAETRTAFVVISHDRAFLNALTRATLWVDRGQVRRNEQGFASFEAWRDKVWDEEDTARHKLDRKIKSEARWAVEGISARRKRNQGRVRALADLRAERAAMIRRQSTAAMVLEEGPQSGRKVIEAKGISKSFGDTQILKPFDLRILRGDRVGFVGPNGAGKTTLLNMLTGQLAPDTGHVTLGKGLEMAVFDQNRAGLNPEASLWDSLTLDREIAVNGSSDQVMVRGSPRHVMGYLKDFLFDEAQARAPVRSLSGGERARLMLAKIMARESNLLILDEPTNDLDVETLDLLQDLLGDYAGTVLLVSHDRDFLDRVATSTVVLEGQGRAQAYAGGWSDALAQGARIGAAPEDREAPPAAKSGPDRVVSNAGAKPAAGLSFTETHRLKELPSVIARLEAEMGKLSELLSDPDLYTREPVKFAKATEALAERQAKLAAAEEEWLLLEEKAQGA